jgi:2-keto-4-pentenoate hydratase/2-oxohepta-3-ene-1,7-dioic acid hydratase in catechol pathway
MKLATFAPNGSDEVLAGAVEGHHVTAFTDGSTVLDRLASGDTTPARGESWPLSDVRLLAPVERPRAIFGIGLNYLAHAQEQNAELPERPIVFMKLPTSVAAPGAPVHAPEVVKRLDYEGELAVVIGPGGEVAGYAVADDLTARDLQRAERQWTRAKGFDGACPFGPWITTADEVAEPGNLALRTWINGELRQDSNTNDLIFGIPEIVAFIGETITLEPGDLILTGTPSGVGMYFDPPRFLGSGDVVRIEIEGLGTIEHAVA